MDLHLGRHEQEQKAKDIRDRYLPFFYKRHALNGQFAFIDGDKKKESPITKYVQLHGGDTVCNSPKTGSAVYFEEKFDFHLPNNFCLEIESNTTTSPPVPGWMYTIQAHYLLYCFIWLKDHIDVYLIDFPQLKAQFETICNRSQRPPYKVPDTYNQTLSRIISVKDVFSCIGFPAMRRYIISSQGDIKQVPSLASLSAISLQLGYVVTPLLYAVQDKEVSA